MRVSYDLMGPISCNELQRQTVVGRPSCLRGQGFGFCHNIHDSIGERCQATKDPCNEPLTVNLYDLRYDSISSFTTARVKSFGRQARGSTRLSFEMMRYVLTRLNGLSLDWKKQGNYRVCYYQKEGPDENSPRSDVYELRVSRDGYIYKR